MNRNIWIGIAVVIVLAAGGCWWYFNQSSAPAASESTQLPSEQNTNTYTPPVTTTQPSQPAQIQPTQATPTPSNGAPAGWSTYTNSQYGFSVYYPVDMTYTLSNPGRFSNGSVSFSVGSGQTGSGQLDMGFPLSSDYCNVPKTDASHTAPTDLRIETIGGVNFSVYTNTSAPPTESYKEIIFQGLRNGSCYFFTEDVMGGSVLSSVQIQAKLDAVVQTFHFGN